MAPGSIAQDPLQLSTLANFGRGIANVAGQNFVFYIVDSKRVRFISTSGACFPVTPLAQVNVPSALNGGFVFVVGGSSPNWWPDSSRPILPQRI